MEEQPPILIMLDLIIPEMNGLEFLQIARRGAMVYDPGFYSKHTLAHASPAKAVGRQGSKDYTKYGAA